MNGAVVIAVAAQRIEVGRGHLTLVQRELDGVGAERAVGGADGGAAPIGYKRMDQRISGCVIQGITCGVCGDLGTEIVGV